MPTEKSLVVIGVGNLVRGDDAIGRLTLRALATKKIPEVFPIEIEGEATQVLEALTGAGAAIVIDACRSGATAGTIHRFDVSDQPLPATLGSFSSHGFGLAAGLELARNLNLLPCRCVVFAIEVDDFTCGAAPDARLSVWLDELLARVEQEIETIRLSHAS